MRLYWTYVERTTKKTLLDIRGKDVKEDFTGHTWKGRQMRLYWTYVERTTNETLMDIHGKDDK